VLFCNAAAAYCGDLNILGQAQLTANGTASLNLILPVGPHQIRAQFHGTKSYAASSSPTEKLIVSGQNPTTTEISSVQSLGSYALTGTVTGFGAPSLTGAIAFKDGANHKLPLATVSVGSPALVFTPLTTSTDSDTNPFPGAVGDFNRDGKLDQIVSEYYNSKVFVLLGNGDGTFVEGPSIPVGSYPDVIAIGDFNNDDILDFVVGCLADGTVSVFLGNGDGTFSAGTSLSVGQNPYYISVGDINNDGNADLVISSDSGTGIWFGDGKGGFTLSAQPMLPGAGTGISVADLNGDGIADLLYSFNVYLGLGDGNFDGPHPLAIDCYGGCATTVVADFNGDGKPDVVVGDSGEYDSGGPGNVSLLPGNGDGTFGPLTVVGQCDGPSFLLGDLNGDGKLDILMNDGWGYAIFFFGNGDGTFTWDYPFIPFLPTTYAIFSVGDFNGDGITDLTVSDPTVVGLAKWQASVVASGVTVDGSPGIHNVFANYEGDAAHAASVSSQVGLQGPKLATVVTLDASPTPLAPGQKMRLVATVTPSVVGNDKATGTITFSDGPKVLMIHQIADGRTVYYTSTLPIGSNISLTAYYSGDTRFDSSVSLPVQLTTRGTLRPISTIGLSVSPSQQVAQGDVVTLSAKVLDAGKPLPIGLVIFYGTTSAHAGKTILGQAQLTPAGVATIKFRPPLGSLGIQAIYQGTNVHAGCESTLQNLTVKGRYHTSTAISVDPLTYSATVTAYGPLAASGDVSFIDATDSNLVFATAPLSLSNTQLGLSRPTLPNVGAGQLAVAVADFNGDGILDAATITQSKELLILLGSPDGTFTQGFTANLNGTSSSIAVADFNMDGIPDLVALTSYSRGPVAVFLGRGDGTFINQPMPTLGIGQLSVVTGDFNGDGIPDLVTTNNDGSATVLLGNGDGTFYAAASPRLGAAPTGAAVVADFNGDGIPDVVTAVQSSSNSVTVLLGNGDGTFVAKRLPVSLTGTPDTVAEADFNGDGIPDILLTGSNSYFSSPGDIQMLLGNGNGTFTPWTLTSSSVPAATYSAVTTDLNADGIPDLVLAGYYNQVSILLGKGNGSFATGLIEHISGGGYLTGGVAIGDFNGKGMPDILAAIGGRNTMTEWSSYVEQTSQAKVTDVTLPGSGTQQVYARYPGDTTHIGSYSETAPATATSAAHQSQ
jgi:hypothetical protein